MMLTGRYYCIEKQCVNFSNDIFFFIIIESNIYRVNF